MKNRTIKSIFLATVLLLATTHSAYSDTVVAKVGKKTVTLKGIKNLHANGPDQIKKAPLEVAFRPLRDQEVLKLLIEDAKSKANLSNDEEVKKLMDEARVAIEMQVFLKRALEKRITDDKLKAFYNEISQKMKNQKEFDVSIILVDNENTANKVLNDLDSGKDFNELAKQYSKDPNSQKTGGKIGYIPESALAMALSPEAAAAIKTSKDGTHYKKVIKLKNGGFLIVRTDGRRAAKLESFETLKPQLKSLHAQQALIKYVEELAEDAKKQSDFKVYTIEGKEDVFKLTSAPAATPAA